MEDAWVAVGPLAAAALMFLLGAVLLWLNAGARAVRAFVAFLVVRSGIILATAWGQVAGGADAVAADRTLAYFDLALAATLVWLLSVYPRPRGAFAGRVGAGVFAVVVLAGFVALVVDPCVVACGGVPGPLVTLQVATPAAAGFGAAVLYRDAAHEPREMQRASMALLATGLLVESAIGAGASVAFLPETLADPRYLGVTFLPILATLAGALALVASLRARRAPLAIALGASGAAFLASLLALALPSALAAGAMGLARLALPLAATLALLRHRLFGLDLRVRLAARRATVGAIFAGVFFVVTEAAVVALGARFGVFAGIFAVGALVPLLGPLRRAADRISQFLPGEDVAPRELPIERRRQIYGDFAAQAWADGRMARSERAFLNELRVRLDLSAEDALSLESDAARSNPE